MRRTKLTKTSGIYQIQSTINNKIYVGSAVNFKSRLLQGHLDYLRNKRHYNRYLQNHVDKYGINDLVFSILEFCPKKKLIEREQYYIDVLCPEFNISPTAGSQLGFRFSEESKQKISKAGKGKPHSEEHKRKISKSNTGKKHSEETKKKISKENKGKLLGYKHPEEFGRKISRALKGHIISEETRKKISNSKKGKGVGKDNSFYGKHHSKESKRKSKESHKIYYESNEGKEFKQRLRELYKGKIPWNKGLTKENDERIKKQGETNKKYWLNKKLNEA